MKTFTCWCRDVEEEEDAVTVRAYNAGDAAEDYASQVYDNSGGDSCTDGCTVVVTCVATGAVKEYEVVVDFSPSFSAFET